MKILVTTLDINYPSTITNITIPFMKLWAKRIGADFKIIKDRKFPQFVISMEKFQIKEYLQEYDWVIFLDADLLVHPDTPNFTDFLQKDTFIHWAWMLASSKYKSNPMFQRDKRGLGIASTLICVSNWMEDLFDIEGITQESLSDQIMMIQEEINFKRFLGSDTYWFSDGWFSDEFALAYNMAKYGLKAIAIRDFIEQLPVEPKTYCFAHEYLWTTEAKEKMLADTVVNWRIG